MTIRLVTLKRVIAVADEAYEKKVSLSSAPSIIHRYHRLQLSITSGGAVNAAERINRTGPDKIPVGISLMSDYVHSGSLRRCVSLSSFVVRPTILC